MSRIFTIVIWLLGTMIPVSVYGDQRIPFSYTGPTKTAFVISQAEAIARYFGRGLQRDDKRPSIYVFSNDDLFKKLTDESYVRREFRNSHSLQEQILKFTRENFSQVDTEEGICFAIAGQDSSPRRFSIIFINSKRDVQEIEVCTADMLFGAIKFLE